MIAFLNGKVESVSQISVIVEVAGIGYECFVSTSTAGSLTAGDNVKLHTHMVVREDGMSLYGFLSIAEKSIFLRLISVSGVGAKIALQVLSGLSANSLANAIASGNVVALSSVKGIGKKTAERIVVELKDKMTGEISSVDNPIAQLNSSASEAVAALVALGYSNNEATKSVVKISGSDKLSVEQIILLALKG